MLYFKCRQLFIWERATKLFRISTSAAGITISHLRAIVIICKGVGDEDPMRRSTSFWVDFAHYQDADFNGDDDDRSCLSHFWWILEGLGGLTASRPPAPAGARCQSDES